MLIWSALKMDLHEFWTKILRFTIEFVGSWKPCGFRRCKTIYSSIKMPFIVFLLRASVLLGKKGTFSGRMSIGIALHHAIIKRFGKQHCSCNSMAGLYCCLLCVAMRVQFLQSRPNAGTALVQYRRHWTNAVSAFVHHLVMISSFGFWLPNETLVERVGFPWLFLLSGELVVGLLGSVLATSCLVSGKPYSCNPSTTRDVI